MVRKIYSICTKLISFLKKKHKIGPDFHYEVHGTGTEEIMVASLPTSLYGEVAWLFGGSILPPETRSDFQWRLHCPGKPEDGGCEWIYHQNALVRRDWGAAITF